jgi:hypothetical protein
MLLKMLNGMAKFPTEVEDETGLRLKGAWLLKQNLMGVGGLQTYIRIVPGRPRHTLQVRRPQLSPCAGAVSLNGVQQDTGPLDYYA